eukprot:1160632-Pelagomonas_calceolata.AAC.13
MQINPGACATPLGHMPHRLVSNCLPNCNLSYLRWCSCPSFAIPSCTASELPEGAPWVAACCAPSSASTVSSVICLLWMDGGVLDFVQELSRNEESLGISKDLSRLFWDISNKGKRKLSI